MATTLQECERTGHSPVLNRDRTAFVCSHGCGTRWERKGEGCTSARRYETRALYPKLYRGALGKNGMLLHTAEVNDAGDVLAVLCGKVKPENVDEVALMEGHEGDPPDCPTCLRRDPRFAGGAA